MSIEFFSGRLVKAGRLGIVHALVISAVLVSLYMAVRSPFLASDGEYYVELARSGDPTSQFYGEPAHFLQIPLTHWLWLALKQLGLPVTVREVFLGIGLLSNVVAAIFIGLIAEALLDWRDARWLASLLFGTSLNAWIQWNGELYALALAFVHAAAYFALRGRIMAAAVLWALSVLSHVEFVLVAPAFAVAVWIGKRDGNEVTSRRKLVNGASVCALAAIFSLLFVLGGGWILGKWHDPMSAVEWLRQSYQPRRADLGGVEPLRAIKGLVTAYSVGGHFWADILRGRGAYDQPLFVLAGSVGSVVLVLTAVWLLMAWHRRRVLLFGLAWVLPVHVIFNWHFTSAVEEYHAAALSGFILLVTCGMVHWAGRPAPGVRRVLCAAYVGLFAGLNLFGSVLPVKAYAADVVQARVAIRELAGQSQTSVVFLTCNNDVAIDSSGVEYIRVRKLLAGGRPLAEVREEIIRWAVRQVEAGRDLYVLGRSCFLGEWLPNPGVPVFDFEFLERYWEIVPTSVRNVPLNWVSQTNPFSWRRADVFRAARRK